MPAPHDIGFPLCESRETLACVHRQSVPVQQNQLPASAAEARSPAHGSLRLQWCPQCGFGFNADFDPDLGNTGVGFDPAYSDPAEVLGGRMTFQRRDFDSNSNVEADVVICRNVIEHVPRPVEFLQSIVAAMAQGRGRRLFLETPALDWILEHHVIWDLFYEHCSLFTARSLTSALAAAGFGDVRVRRVFGAQYLWAEATLGDSPSTPIPSCEPLTRLAVEFSQHAARRTSDWVDMLQRMRRDGDVAVWGAGAKGVTFCHLMDPHCQRIDAVIDINPAKQGMFVSGTGHPIVSPADWAPRTRGHVLVLNPNYHMEVAATLRRLQSRIRPIDLMALESAA